MVNMDFIASKTGLSRYTVSRALAQNPKVRPETIRQVLDACEKYGYIRNSHAVSLVKGQSNLIGVVVPYITDNFYSDFIGQLDEFAEANNFHILYRSSYNDSNSESLIIRNYLAIKVCAMIIVPVVTNPDIKTHQLANENIPVIYFDRPLGDLGFSILNNNRQGMFDLTEHIISLGRIPAYLGSFYGTTNSTAEERRQGYLLAMEKYGLIPREIALTASQEQQDNERFGYDNMKASLTVESVSDALICITDAVALGAIRALQEYNLKPGVDVLVAGHDNLRFAEFITPSLTTVSQPQKSFTLTCLDIICKSLAGDPPAQKRYVFPPELILRESTENTRPTFAKKIN